MLAALQFIEFRTIRWLAGFVKSGSLERPYGRAPEYGHGNTLRFLYAARSEWIED
jgi:hypothetical protein